MNDSENNMDKYFKNLTDRERAIFEGGISMGSLYHQFVGTPVNLDTCPLLEKAIEESIMLQAAVIDVVVKLDKQLIKEATVVSTYTSLEGNMLNIELATQINEEVVTTCISYNQELDYPLMYIKD
jgi:hypothetical protein